MMAVLIAGGLGSGGGSALLSPSGLLEALCVQESQGDHCHQRVSVS